jgi:hypothetical protein
MNVQIIRLQTGEDIVADLIIEDTSHYLYDAMQIIFKRTTSGTILMMLPWLPIELVKDNVAKIDKKDILTIVEPKPSLIEYYINLIDNDYFRNLVESDSLIETFQKQSATDFSIDSDENVFDDFYDSEEIDSEEESLVETTKKKNMYH